MKALFFMFLTWLNPTGYVKGSALGLISTSRVDFQQEKSNKINIMPSTVSAQEEHSRLERSRPSYVQAPDLLGQLSALQTTNSADEWTSLAPEPEPEPEPSSPASADPSSPASAEPPESIEPSPSSLPLPAKVLSKNTEEQNPALRANKTRKSSPVKKAIKPKKTSSSKTKKAWVLFEWLSENHISLEWAYAFLDPADKDLYAPALLKEKITNSFKNEALLYFNFHRNIIRFPYVLDGGLKASIGLARSYDLKSDYFFPLSLSAIMSLRIWKHQFIVPFLEGGFSSWNINVSGDFSDIFPFWTVGAFVSLSLFKPSLRYIFANDYGVQDIGFIGEWRNHLSPFKKEDKRGAFLRTLHLGLYVHF